MIRAAQQQDLQAMAALHALCFVGEDSWSAAQIEGSLALATTIGLVAQEDEKVKGFLLAQKVQDEAEILTLCIHPDNREQGLAKALVEALLAQEGLGTAFLEVAADNTPARRLYENCGFTVFGTRPAYYKRGGQAVDAITYRLLVKT